MDRTERVRERERERERERKRERFKSKEVRQLKSQRIPSNAKGLGKKRKAKKNTGEYCAELLFPEPSWVRAWGKRRTRTRTR